MRARLWAACLVLLIALPFTAPFSTCDLATLLAAPAPHAIGHSLGSSKVDATSIAPVVTMEEDEHTHACDLEAPLDTTETVTVVAVVVESVSTSVVVRTSPLPLRL